MAKYRVQRRMQLRGVAQSSGGSRRAVGDYRLNISRAELLFGDIVSLKGNMNI